MGSLHILGTLVVSALLISQLNGMLYYEKLNAQDINILFMGEECIEGFLSVSEISSVHSLQTLSFTEDEVKLNENKSSNMVNGKSPMSSVHELAFFNNIKYQYVLTDEEGPAHKKLFNVSLQLGDETYFSEGNSIKKAQHIAAKLALIATNYNHPPSKSVTEKQSHKPSKRQNSVQQLEDWLSKHWDATPMYSSKEQSAKCDRNFYHDDMYSNANSHEVTVTVGNKEFTAEGLTFVTAKQKAASSALEQLIINDAFCLFEEKGGNMFGQFFDSDIKNDSPISLIHQFSSRIKAVVSFDFIREDGPSHMKVFEVKCSIGEKFVSFGEDSSKKTAKNKAAVNMIEKLKSYAYENNFNCNNAREKNKRRKPRNSRKLVKSVVKFESEESEKKPQYSFPDDINPISKLMQIQQSKYDLMPVFTLLEEKGDVVKEFVIEVRVGNLVYVGSGPNKKTAKRKAAEGMLQMLGYSRSSEGVRDSLSDQKKKEFSSENTSSQKKHLVSGIFLNSKLFSQSDHGKDFSSTKSNPSEVRKNQGVSPEINDKLQSFNQMIEKTASNFKAPLSELDNISKDLGFRYQLRHREAKGDPSKVCYGIGSTVDISQEKAARAGLKDLYKSRLYAISETLQDSFKHLDAFESWKHIVVKEPKKMLLDLKEK